MFKCIPYRNYEVKAIEEWVNEYAERGYRVAQIYEQYVKFVKNTGPRVYYRVRYIPDNKEINGAFWYEDLYFYHSTNPGELPPADYEGDSLAAAAVEGKPTVWHAIMLVVAIVLMISEIWVGYVPAPYRLMCYLGALDIFRIYCMQIYWMYHAFRIYKNDGKSEHAPIRQNYTFSLVCDAIVLVVIAATYIFV